MVSPNHRFICMIRMSRVSLLYRGVLPRLLEGLSELVALLGDQLVSELPDSVLIAEH